MKSPARHTISTRGACLGALVMLLCLNVSLANLGDSGDTGTDLLTQVLKTGDWEFAKGLIVDGADVSGKPPNAEDDSTPLHLAIWHKRLHPSDTIKEADVQLVELIVDKLSKEDLNAPDGRGVTPLMRAIEAHNYEIARILLNKGADPFQTAKAWRIDEPMTPFHRGINHNAPVDLLLHMLSGIDAKSFLNNGPDYLFMALRKERWDLVKELLELGADPFRVTGATGESGRSARSLAESLLNSKRGVDPKGQVIVEYIANLTPPETYSNPRVDLKANFSPLMMALDEANWKAAERLIEQGEQVSKPEGPAAMHSPYELALLKTTEEEKEPAPLELIKLIVKGMDQADLSSTNTLGQTPLMFAIDRNRWDVVSHLLDLGVDPAQKAKPRHSRVEKTPLEQAVARGAPADLVERFLSFEEVRKTINEGDDLVRRAIQKLSWKVAKVLLDNGANPRRDLGPKLRNAYQSVELELAPHREVLNDKVLDLVDRIMSHSLPDIDMSENDLSE